VWSQNKSVILSLVCTRVIIVGALALAVALPSIARFAEHDYGNTIFSKAMPVYYAFCIPALVALFVLDRLLLAIRRDEVFTGQNVRYLRIISWCCVVAALVLLAGGFVSIYFLALAIVAAFFGVVLRVVKNLFAAAVALKDENDYTI